MVGYLQSLALIRTISMWPYTATWSKWFSLSSFILNALINVITSAQYKSFSKRKGYRNIERKQMKDDWLINVRKTGKSPDHENISCQNIIRNTVLWKFNCKLMLQENNLPMCHSIKCWRNARVFFRPTPRDFRLNF